MYVKQSCRKKWYVTFLCIVFNIGNWVQSKKFLQQKKRYRRENLIRTDAPWNYRFSETYSMICCKSLKSCFLYFFCPIVFFLCYNFGIKNQTYVCKGGLISEDILTSNPQNKIGNHCASFFHFGWNVMGQWFNSFFWGWNQSENTFWEWASFFKERNRFLKKKKKS